MGFRLISSLVLDGSVVILQLVTFRARMESMVTNRSVWWEEVVDAWAWLGWLVIKNDRPNIVVIVITRVMINSLANDVVSIVLIEFIFLV